MSRPTPRGPCTVSLFRPTLDSPSSAPISMGPFFGSNGRAVWPELSDECPLSPHALGFPRLGTLIGSRIQYSSITTATSRTVLPSLTGAFPHGGPRAYPGGAPAVRAWRVRLRRLESRVRMEQLRRIDTQRTMRLAFGQPAPTYRQATRRTGLSKPLRTRFQSPATRATASARTGISSATGLQPHPGYPSTDSQSSNAGLQLCLLRQPTIAMPPAARSDLPKVPLKSRTLVTELQRQYACRELRRLA